MRDVAPVFQGSMQRQQANWERLKSASGDWGAQVGRAQDAAFASYERERGACEKLRYPIQALATPGLHEREQGQNKPNDVTDHRHRNSGLRSPAHHGTWKRTAHEAESKKEKRREPKFAQVIHAPVA